MSGGRSSRRAISYDELPPHLKQLVDKTQAGREAQRPTQVAEPKPTKYRSRSVEGREHVLYDSKLEWQTAEWLDGELRAGRILRWSWGPRVVLQRDPARAGTLVTYRPDFIVWRLDGSWFAIDAKGMKTQQFQIKARMWKVQFPNNLLVLATKKDGLKAA